MIKRNTSARTPPVVLVLDIETEPFTSEFRRSVILADRLKCCPKIRLAGVYNSCTRKYSFYGPDQCRALIQVLLTADLIVTYNGNKFDFLVLRRHGGLSERTIRKIQQKHVDLYEAIRMETGRSFKLDQLARTNLNESKMVHGREMSNLDTLELRKANRSDLSQTYRLWKLRQHGKLVCPPYAQRSRFEVEVVGGPHSQLRPGMYVDLDTEDMTEGQMAEYLAGTWGITVNGEFIEM